MAVEQLDVEESKKIAVSNGYHLSQKACIIISVVVTIALIGLVVGISVVASSDKSCDASSELIGAVSTVATSLTRTTVTTTAAPSVYRLPTNLKPYSYEITLSATTDSLTEPDEFDGYVKISFKCEERTDHIKFHQGDLEIGKEINVKQLSNGSLLNVSHESYDEETEIFDLHLTSFLEANQNYSISMHYSGHLKDNNFGLYKSFYYNPNGVKTWLITTQMESTGARLAFPCFDEPSMKATFKMSFVHHKSLKALSNMPGTSLDM